MANASYRGRMIVNDTDYTGSFVDPNPSGVATENLNTVSIDGKIFNVVGSGGGITTYRGLTNPPIALGNEGDIYYKCNGNIVDNYVLIDSTELPADFKFEGGVLLSVTIPNGATKIKLNCYNYGQSPTEIILDFSDISMTNDHPYSGGSQGVQVFSTLWAGKDNDYIYFESATGAYVWVASGYFDIPIYTYIDIIASYNKTSLDWIGSPEYIEDVYVNNESVLDANRIAQVFSHQEVTEQEYGALPNTKESDNIMYCVKGSRPSTNGNYFTPIIYSTEEREVGVWTDGKPLYQKTFDCGALLNTQTKEVSFTEDMETATIIDAFAMSTSEGYIISLPDVVPNYVAGSVRVYISKTAKKIYIYSQADMSTYDKSYVTIQYTKTTDVAGSAQYTTLGVPAVHYDGNEKIVGTYYGETLYEKSYIQQLNNGETQISISDLNANYAFIESGFYDIGVTKLALNELIDINGRLYTYTHINTGSQYLNIDCKNTVSATSTIHITIRYTKTS